MKSCGFLIFFLIGFSISSSTPAFENKNIVKTVDLTKAIVYVSIKITAIPVDKFQDEYFVVIPRNDYDHLSSIEVVDSKMHVMHIRKTDDQKDENFVMYAVSDRDPFEELFVFYIYYHMTHVLKSLPEIVSQNDIPMFVFTDSLYVQSPYYSRKQEIQYKLPLSKFESASEVSPKRVNGDMIIYGPFKKLEAFPPSETITIHFPSLAHFITFDHVEREIEVSHWGNVAVEEVVRARNSGTPLSGEFSRLDYFRSDPEQIAAWETLHGSIDKMATDIYYRDMIGNVTTSHIRRDGDTVNVELNMRFPMMGGWKNEFYWGYNLPSGRILRKEGFHFFLDIPFSTPLMEADIQELSVKIILPECVKNVKFYLPENVAEPTLDYRYTYLDSAMKGRPVYEMKKTNLIDLQKDEIITVSYDLNLFMLLREPFMCITAFFSLFLLKSIVKLFKRQTNIEKDE